MNPKSHFEVKIVKDDQELEHVGAEMFANYARTALKSRSLFTVVLSGGSTPRPLYERLAKEQVNMGLPWEKIHFFWSDERNVDPSDSESNFHMAWESMLCHLSISENNIHRIRTELLDPRLVAEDYENTIRSFFGLKNISEKPHFDLSFLGLGSDGHTASLFPEGQPNFSVSKEKPNRLVIAPWVPHLNDFRISLTPNALNGSRNIIFLVSGTEKASLLATVLEGEKSGHVAYPAQAIQPTEGRLTWLVDKSAAEFLNYEEQCRNSGT
jgi:6-phosphogluconolactonase